MTGYELFKSNPMAEAFLRPGRPQRCGKGSPSRDL